MIEPLSHYILILILPLLYRNKIGGIIQDLHTLLIPHTILDLHPPLHHLPYILGPTPPLHHPLHFRTYTLLFLNLNQHFRTYTSSSSPRYRLVLTSKHPCTTSSPPFSPIIIYTTPLYHIKTTLYHIILTTLFNQPLHHLYTTCKPPYTTPLHHI